MMRVINPIKLKTVAEHLEWVLKKYPENDDVQNLLRALTPMIEDAKAARIVEPVDMMDVPGAWNFSDGRYIPYKDPNVDNAYVEFSIEVRGGLTEQDRQRIQRIDAMRRDMANGVQS